MPRCFYKVRIVYINPTETENVFSWEIIHCLSGHGRDYERSLLNSMRPWTPYKDPWQLLLLLRECFLHSTSTFSIVNLLDITSFPQFHLAAISLDFTSWSSTLELKICLQGLPSFSPGCSFLYSSFIYIHCPAQGQGMPWPSVRTCPAPSWGRKGHMYLL